MVLIHELYPVTNPCDIECELSELGDLVHNVTNIQIKKSRICQ